MHRMAALLSALAICQFNAWAISAGSDGIGIPHYLPGHMLMETGPIVIAMMVFAVGWNFNLGKT